MGHASTTGTILFLHASWDLVVFDQVGVFSVSQSVGKHQVSVVVENCKLSICHVVVA